MKKLLITCGFIFSCCAVNAQWYTPITRESNNSNNQQAQSQQQIRTITAYCIDRSTGGCLKPLLRFLSKIQFVLLLFTKAVRLELCGKKSELYLFTNVQGLPMMNSKAVFLTRQLF